MNKSSYKPHHNVVFDVFRPHRAQKFSKVNHATWPEFEDISFEKSSKKYGLGQKKLKNAIVNRKLIFLTQKKCFVVVRNIEIKLMKCRYS